MTTLNSVTASPSETVSLSTAKLTVMQPEKLGDLLNTISLIDSISERIGENKSIGPSGAGGSSGTAGTQGDDGQSTRDQIIANLPSVATLQKQLVGRIQSDITALRKQLQKQTLRSNKPGSAYRYALLYGKIRRLNSFLSALFSSTADIIKRIYIRVFVDKQEVL